MNIKIDYKLKEGIIPKSHHGVYFYMYKITNNINNKFYIGVHKTKNLDDGYPGSGLRLHEAYKKYGVRNFKKEIIKFFNSIDEMFEYEKQIVNDEFRDREDTYNIVTGGLWGRPNVNGQHNGMFGKIPWNKGIKRSKECIEKMSENRKGINIKILKLNKDIKGIQTNTIIKGFINTTKLLHISSNTLTQMIEKGDVQVLNDNKTPIYRNLNLSTYVFLKDYKDFKVGTKFNGTTKFCHDNHISSNTFKKLKDKGVIKKLLE